MDAFNNFFQVVMKQNAVIEHLKQKKTMTPAEREENQRLVAAMKCHFSYNMDSLYTVAFSLGLGV